VSTKAVRVCALVLGVTLTAVYAYAGHVALASVPAARRHAALVDRADASPGRLYYGGTLEPITVVATASAVPTIAAASPEAPSPADSTRGS
jgi:hypothetical protein